MDFHKLDKLFLEAARSCDQIPKEDLDYAVDFQQFARQRKGKEYPLDRILLKFGFLLEDQILALYKAIRYYTWRKEDKFFLKIATQSGILSQRKADNCLLEQKNLFRDQATLLRVNEIARRRVYMTEKQETRIIEAMRDCRETTMTVTNISLDADKPVVPLKPKAELRGRAKSRAAVAPPTRDKAMKATVPDSTINRSDDDAFLSDSGSSGASVGGFAPIDSFEADGSSFDGGLDEASGFAPVDSMADSGDFGSDSFGSDSFDAEASFASDGSQSGVGSFAGESDLGSGFSASDSFLGSESGLGGDPFGDSFEGSGFTDSPLRGPEASGSMSGASFGGSDAQGFSFADDDDDSFASGLEDERSDFSAMRTEDDLDSILPLHEDDAIDNLMGRKAGKRGKPARGQKPVGGRSDPFLDSQDPSMDLLSDDELDALWDDTQIDKLDLDSGSQKSNRGSPLLDSDFGSSSEDDLF